MRERREKQFFNFSNLLLKPAYLGILLSLAIGSGDQIITAQETAINIPQDFVDIEVEIPNLEVDVRYFSSDNFVGSPIDGYRAARIILSRPATNALTLVQNELRDSGLGLKVFDAYRPQVAVDHFVRWAQDLSATEMKQKYYPAVDKANLFRDGYIAERSGHSRGSTVDLTLIELDSGQELDMGTTWDFFDPRSWPSSEAVNKTQYENRMMLRQVMLKNGFLPYSEEWWHFTLVDEPFPDTYFAFEIR